jgi:Domain of unknown function (DUF4082)
MKRILAAAALLALAACGDADPLLVERGPQRAAPDPALSATEWTIFTSETPAEVIDAPGGWEVGTQFSTAKAGSVVGFRWYKAPGETGGHTARLWNGSGVQIAEATFANETASGWQTVYFPAVAITPAMSYRVSVNTNTKQVKTYAALQGGTITNGPLTADYSWYGQPTGAFPSSGSLSTYFVDVIFREEIVQHPNLYVNAIIANGGKNAKGEEIVTIAICNNGNATAGPSVMRLAHQVVRFDGSYYISSDRQFSLPAIGPGGCAVLQPVTWSVVNAFNEYHVWADYLGQVAESNEGDNFKLHIWRRLF